MPGRACRSHLLAMTGPAAAPPTPTLQDFSRVMRHERPVVRLLFNKVACSTVSVSQLVPRAALTGTSRG